MDGDLLRAAGVDEVLHREACVSHAPVFVQGKHAVHLVSIRVPGKPCRCSEMSVLKKPRICAPFSDSLSVRGTVFPYLPGKRELGGVSSSTSTLICPPIFFPFMPPSVCFSSTPMKINEPIVYYLLFL